MTREAAMAAFERHVADGRRAVCRASGGDENLFKLTIFADF